MRKPIKLTVHIVALLCCILVLASCAVKPVFNEITVLTSYTPPNIEGSYNEEISAEDFQSLTGIDLQSSLPDKYKDKAVPCLASYDGNDEVLCIFTGFGDENGYTGLTVFSKKRWSDQTYYPIDFNYQDETFNKTTIMNIPAVFVHYDDSQVGLGHDAYMAEITINDIGIDIESSILSQDEFVAFIERLIQNTKSPQK